MNSKKKWSNNDLLYLAILYYMGANKQEIAKVLTRTESSIAKHLSRCKIKIKKSSQYNYKINRYFPEICMIEVISQTVKKFYYQYKKELYSNDLNTICIFLKKLFPPIQVIISKKSDLDKCRAINIDRWFSERKLLQKLQNNGISVVLLSSITYEQMGFKYLLNNKPINSVQLLLEVNKIQIQNNSSVIFGDNITEEGWVPQQKKQCFN